MLTLIRKTTNQPMFRSNSIYGILDILLMNWLNDPNFSLAYDETTGTIIVNDIDYLLKYTEMNGNPRGEDTTNE